jgi:hypothetical protein
MGYCKSQSLYGVGDKRFASIAKQANFFKGKAFPLFY